jgi:acyl dehydratase
MTTNVHPVAFDLLSVGDALPPFTIGETQETINQARPASVEADSSVPNIHTDPEFAKNGLFTGTVNAGVITMAYVTQMLERWFPASTFYNGGRLLFKAIEPMRPGDSATFEGTITCKRVEGGRKIVDCEIKGVNQLGGLIGVAEVTLVLEE